MYGFKKIPAIPALHRKCFKTSGFMCREPPVVLPAPSLRSPRILRPKGSLPRRILDSGSGRASAGTGGIDGHTACSYNAGMSSQHTRFRLLVRAEIRTLLAELLAALPPAGPVVASPAAEESASLALALDAWEALREGASALSAGEAVAARLTRPDAWAAFCEAASGVVTGHAVAACRSLAADRAVLGRDPGKPAHALGNVLKQLRGRVVGGRVMVGELNRRTKTMRWRVAAVAQGGASPAAGGGRPALDAAPRSRCP